MDTNRIRYFISLSKTGSITRAAELHHISAAAFSKSMKVFETEVGHTLTLQQGRGIALTDYARSLIPRLEAIIQQIDSINDGMGPATNEKVLRIATFEVFSTYFMTRAVHEFFSDYHCEVRELIPGKMEEAVAGGAVDLALTYIPIPHSDLDHLRVCAIQMGVFGQPKLLKNSDLESLPFAAPASPIGSSPNKVRGLDGWPDGAFPRKIQYRVDLLQTALGLCHSGLAVAYLPKFVTRLHNETVKPSLALEELALPKKFPATHDFVYLVKRKSDLEGPTAKLMAKAVRKICV